MTDWIACGAGSVMFVSLMAIVCDNKIGIIGVILSAIVGGYMLYLIGIRHGKKRAPKPNTPPIIHQHTHEHVYTMNSEFPHRGYVEPIPRYYEEPLPTYDNGKLKPSKND